MLLTTKGRYSVMAMVDLVFYSKDSRPLKLQDIAQRQGIALNYLEQIFSKLKQMELVKSMKGPGGGYILNKDATQVSVLDIINAVGEPVKMTRCDSKVTMGCMNDKTLCLTHNLWDGLGKKIEEYLNSISLASMCETRIYEAHKKNENI